VDNDAELVARLQAGDERAFMTLVDRFHAPLLRLAGNYVPNRAVAEEVVQDTWLGVVRGIERFEGRSSLKTWLFRIAVNRARTTGVRERREPPVDPSHEPAVSPERFAASGQWARPPAPWADEADERIAARQTVAHIVEHLAELPDGQRHVVLMRDLEGLSAGEVCDVLGISEGNQRVLLHRGRSRIRTVLERELERG
jgi:RNA polymerase sigma-70 factor (ECF subfamily)